MRIKCSDKFVVEAPVGWCSGLDSVPSETRQAVAGASRARHGVPERPSCTIRCSMYTSVELFVEGDATYLLHQLLLLLLLYSLLISLRFSSRRTNSERLLRHNVLHLISYISVPNWVHGIQRFSPLATATQKWNRTQVAAERAITRVVGTCSLPFSKKHHR